MHLTGNEHFSLEPKKTHTHTHTKKQFQRHFIGKNIVWGYLSVPCILPYMTGQHNSNYPRWQLVENKNCSNFWSSSPGFLEQASALKSVFFGLSSVDVRNETKLQELLILTNQMQDFLRVLLRSCAFWLCAYCSFCFGRNTRKWSPMNSLFCASQLFMHGRWTKSCAIGRQLVEANAASGLMLFCWLIQIPLTGCGLNPARALGPAFIKNYWKKHWVSVYSEEEKLSNCHSK